MLDLIYGWLEGTDSLFLDTNFEVLYHKGCESTRLENNKETTDIEFADDHVTTMKERFQMPFENSGMTCSEADLLDEWPDLIIKHNQVIGTFHNESFQVIFHLHKSSVISR